MRLGLSTRVEDAASHCECRAGLARRIWLRLVISGTMRVGSGCGPSWRISYFSLSRYSSDSVLPGATAWRGVLAELVGGAVDAVVGGEGGGEDEALHEGGRRPPSCKLFVQDVRRVGPEVGLEEVADGRLGDLFEVGLKLQPWWCAR